MLNDNELFEYLIRSEDLTLLEQLITTYDAIGSKDRVQSLLRVKLAVAWLLSKQLNSQKTVAT